MSRDVVTHCDQCHLPVPTGRSALWFKGQLATFRGDELQESATAEKDLCSPACAVAAVNDLVRAVNVTAPVNGTPKEAPTDG